MKIDEYPYIVIGLDIGGTKITGAILRYFSKDKIPEIIHTETTPSQSQKGCEIFVNNIISVVVSLLEKAKFEDPNCPVIAIGMGVPGRINHKTGTVMSATDNFPGFVGCELSKIVSEKTKIPTFILNDVQSHTLGELRWGAGKGIKNFIMLAIGTGIGGAIVVNGNLYFGSHGYAGELGHVQACLATSITCSCGKSGHLEAISSGCGIERNYYHKTGQNLTGENITNLAKDGDKIATEIIENSGRALGQILAQYLSVFDPEIIVLSGSVIKSGEIWKRALNDGFKEEVIEDIQGNLDLRYAELGSAAAYIGAAELAMDMLKEQNE